MQIAKQRGFIFPSSEIYGGLSGFYDYGPVGVLLKRRLENYWREFFVRRDENIFETETSLIMHQKVWEASGHLKDFIDPLTQCKKCNSSYRADNLIEEKTGKFVEGASPKELTEILKKEKIKCPRCKGELSEVRIFNLMLSSNIGPVAGNIAYLRPETAQGIFVNFKNLLATTRANLPFGVAQFGRSYRNEISPRQWIIRLREFNQVEIEMFFNPKKANEVPNFNLVGKTKVKILTGEQQKKESKPTEISVEDAVKKGILPTKYTAYFLAKEFLWYQSIGIPAEAIRFRHMKPEETPHYSKGNFDMEIKFDFGWKEVVGNAYRTDFDLSTHSKHSGENFSVVDNGEKVLPHVVEPSFGIDRTIYAILLFTYREGKERGWEWFQFPYKIAPYPFAVFPLVNKDKIPEKAREIFGMLRSHYEIFYDDSGSIGKRYARADEIGVPFCITVDYDSLEKDTITVRDRDTTKQIRIKIKDIYEILWKLVNKEIEFEKAGKLVK